MIHTRQLRKTFVQRKETVEAVKGIDLDVQPGELVALLGPNGAGKSTTLRMLTSLLRPTSGTAIVAGADVATDPSGVRQRIGYIGQGTSGGHSHRVLDELHSQGRFYGLSSAEAARRAQGLVEDLELGAFVKRPVNTLSGGQKRRLDVALGLINRPRLLFLDEPSTGMDPQSRAHLWEHILRLRAELDMTIVLTTHYLEEADTMAERVVIVDHGEVIADSTAATLKQEHAADRLTVTVPAGEAERASAALTRFAEASGIASAEPSARPAGASVRLEVSLREGDRRLPGALRALDADGVQVEAATLSQASLDDVFLALTGRSLREEGAPDREAGAPAKGAER